MLKDNLDKNMRFNDFENIKPESLAVLRHTIKGEPYPSNLNIAGYLFNFA